MAQLILLALLALGVLLWLNARKKAAARREETGTPDETTPGGAEAAAALGLLPAEQLDTSRAAPANPHDEEIRTKVRSGDWQAGADYLAGAGRNWRERYRRLGVLQSEAEEDDSWLLVWRAERPGDADAALVHADALIGVAGNIRGALQAKYTTQEQFAGFHRVMAQAREACHEAQALADADDPCPYAMEIACALSLGYGHDDFRALWAEVEKRGPHLVSAHVSALQYWCRKWRGSHELAEEFARRAAAKGSPGQLLSLLPLYAAFEQETAEEEADPETFYKAPELIAAADACLADLAAAVAANPAEPWIVQVRHLLAWTLYWQDRYEEALEQFRAVDGYIDSAPWTYAGDPLQRYVDVRDYCALQVQEAAGT
ncbi:hypothetical protein [Streptomyces sp. NPDC059452]|uniref:hypothetical protein n=1 Tax=Streptomyces sp. NPDC059452 TaxID=3346835 RepID=UPI00368CD7EB